MITLTLACLLAQTTQTGGVPPPKLDIKDEVHARVLALVRYNLGSTFTRTPRTAALERARQEKAQAMTDLIVREARAHKIDPLIVAITAQKESNFNMAAVRQIGIMQFTRQTWSELYASRGWNAHNWQHNIRGGTDYLARHLFNTVRRNDQGYYWSKWQAQQPRLTFTTQDLKRMWGRYNGCGPEGKYVHSCLKSYAVLQTRPLDAVRKYGTQPLPVQKPSGRKRLSRSKV